MRRRHAAAAFYSSHPFDFTKTSLGNGDLLLALSRDGRGEAEEGIATTHSLGDRVAEADVPAVDREHDPSARPQKVTTAARVLGRAVFSDVGRMVDVDLLLRDVVSLADADGWAAGFVAGVMVWTETGDGTRVVTPVLYESADGTEWQPVDVPLPADVTWNQGFDVAVVLSSAEDGAWKVVSDQSFDQPGRDMRSYRVSASAGRSGSLSRIASRPDRGILGAGFLIATEAFDTGGTLPSVGDPSTSNSALQLLLTPNAVDFANITSEIPGSDAIAVVGGIAEGPDRIALVGMKKDDICGAWIVDPAIRH